MTLAEIVPLTKLPFNGVLLPTFNITEEERVAAQARPNCTALEFMTQLCRNGWKAKSPQWSKEKHAVYAERVKMELDAIETLGFSSYMLMVADICRFADTKSIPRGPGRGSVAGSLVAHLLNISDVDPVENGLFFSRFLSKSRAKKTVVDGITYVDGGLVADIDMDFCYYRRQEVIDYINARYPGQTSKMLTTQMFKSRMLLRDLLKVYENQSDDQTKEVSDLIEDDTGVPVSVEKSLYGDERWQKGDKDSHWPPNDAFVKWSENHRETVELAMDLEGLNHAEGMHASAVAIAAMPINELMPLQLSTKTKEVISGYDMYDVQEMALKFDILGLKCLSVLQDCTVATGVDWRKIDVNDPCIYRELQDFKRRYGIFQLETWAQGTAAAKVKPKTFEQLAAVLAIARPGAIAFLQQFADYVNQGTFTSVHPLIDDILKPTGGVTIYQEQYLAMLVRVGMSPDSAENARRVLGKKQKDKVPEVIAEIEEVCRKNGHPKEIVDLLVQIAYDSGGYSFNASHSYSYSKLTAFTLWFKTRYPLEFFWANLQMIRHESDRYEKLAVVEQEMRALGFALLPPRLSLDGMDFKMESKTTIRCALGMVRGISDENEEKLRLFIDKSGLTPQSNKFEVFQGIHNSGLHIGVGSALIQAGCMSGYDLYTDKDGKSYRSRSRLVLEYLLWAKSDLLKDKERAACMLVGQQTGWDVLNAVKHLVEVAKDEKGRPLIKESRFATIKKHYEPYKEIYVQNSRNERLANYFYEKRTLGYSFSESLRDIFSEHLDGLMTIAEAQKLPSNSKCRLIGFVKEKPYASKTKAGNQQLKIQLTDDSGETIVKIFNESIPRVEEANGRKIEEGDMLIVNAKKVEGSTFFGAWGLDGTMITIQTAVIYTRLADLGRDKKAKEEPAT